MEQETPRRPRRDRDPGRSAIGSPVLALALALVTVGLVGAIFLVPGLLPAPAASPSCGVGCLPPSAAAASPTGTPAATPRVSGLPTFVRPTPTPGPTFMSYTVRAGDSLNTIAHKFNTTARSIAWWNRGTYPSLDPESAGYSPGHIEPGWVLVLIPGGKVDDNNPPTPSPGRPTPTPGPSSVTPSAGSSPSPSA